MYAYRQLSVLRGQLGTTAASHNSAALSDALRRTLQAWDRYYAAYDPAFTWWTSDPYRRADQSLERYVRSLRETIVGIREGEEEPIVGDPIGAEALRAELGYELIAYTPDEILAIAEREFAWCETELKKASRDMGLGDDWKAALERVKNSYLPPGDQPRLIRDLNLAEALNRVLQETSGYARTIGSGESQAPVSGAGLADLWAEAATVYGRKARIRAI